MICKVGVGRARARLGSARLDSIEVSGSASARLEGGSKNLGSKLARLEVGSGISGSSSARLEVSELGGSTSLVRAKLDPGLNQA